MFIVGRGAMNRTKENPTSAGKDHIASKLRDNLGLTFRSSSEWAAEHLIWPQQKKLYKTWEECFNRRHEDNNRKIWFDIISDFNAIDPTRLSKYIFQEYDIYVGIRNRSEFLPSRTLADYSIWIESSERVSELEGFQSCNILPDDCDFAIFNNRSIEDYDFKIDRLCNLLKWEMHGKIQAKNNLDILVKEAQEMGFYK